MVIARSVVRVGTIHHPLPLLITYATKHLQMVSLDCRELLGCLAVGLRPGQRRLVCAGRKTMISGALIWVS